jgi:hypothetical protein
MVKTRQNAAAEKKSTGKKSGNSMVAIEKLVKNDINNSKRTKRVTNLIFNRTKCQDNNRELSQNVARLFSTINKKDNEDKIKKIILSLNGQAEHNEFPKVKVMIDDKD